MSEKRDQEQPKREMKTNYPPRNSHDVMLGGCGDNLDFNRRLIKAGQWLDKVNAEQPRFKVPIPLEAMPNSVLLELAQSCLDILEARDKATAVMKATKAAKD